MDPWITLRRLNVIYFPLKADYYAANLNYDVQIALQYWAVYEFHGWAEQVANKIKHHEVSEGQRNSPCDFPDNILQ